MKAVHTSVLVVFAQALFLTARAVVFHGKGPLIPFDVFCSFDPNQVVDARSFSQALHCDANNECDRTDGKTFCATCDFYHGGISASCKLY
ncbi:uncharacterized protein PSFLO_01054 [Pseudozyma flocculosa]|uniref:Uncharacterized protein n=1 Tax=Pseudozyma flocculosa TaxID=84751 RepID=A0A5C3ETA1_9BASI|nr:uncharacterized protein PSFLO_01054 [Pseudozyma flocculosa]